MKLLNVGQRASINFLDNNKFIEIYCKISEIFDDRLVLELPGYFMRYIKYLSVNNRLTVKVFSKLGTIDFNSIIIASPLEDKFIIELDQNALKLTPNEEIPIIQSMLNLKINGTETLKTFEISTTFLKFYANKNYEIGEKIKCELILPKNYGIITFSGEVTNIDEEYSNEVTITYFNMSEKSREDLLYYMYLYYNNAD